MHAHVLRHLGLACLFGVLLAGIGACTKTPTPTPPAAPPQASPGPAAAVTPGAAPAAPAAAPAATAPEEPPPIPAVVAKVNGVEIRSTAFLEELEKITTRGSQVPIERLTRMRENILKRLIDKELIDQELKRQGVVVSDEEIDAAVAEYKERFRTEEQFQGYLRNSKTTLDQIRERMRAKLALQKLVAKSSDLAVTEDEAREFYATHERFYLDKEAVRAAHILIELDEKAAPEAVAAAEKKIAEIQALLQQGADFADVAREHSQGPSAPNGGDMGFFGRDQMVKPFEDVAFSLPVGEVSPPVRTRFGIHLIKVLERREERKKPFDEVREQILESLRNKRFFRERRVLLQRLSDQAQIERFL